MKDILEKNTRDIPFVYLYRRQGQPEWSSMIGDPREILAFDDLEVRPIYDNTPTVVAPLVLHEKGMLVIRRAREVGKGLLGLPGGYQMRETWQEAAAKEVYEETGYKTHPEGYRQVGETVTDKFGNNLIVCYYERMLRGEPEGMYDPNEVSALFYVNEIGLPTEWAFPLHYRAAMQFIDNPRSFSIAR